MDDRLTLRDWRDDDRESRPSDMDPADVIVWIGVGGLITWGLLSLLLSL